MHIPGKSDPLRHFLPYPFCKRDEQYQAKHIRYQEPEEPCKALRISYLRGREQCRCPYPCSCYTECLYNPPNISIANTEADNIFFFPRQQNRRKQHHCCIYHQYQNRVIHLILQSVYFVWRSTAIRILFSSPSPEKLHKKGSLKPYPDFPCVKLEFYNYH